jgi:hypothetical protein
MERGVADGLIHNVLDHYTTITPKLHVGQRADGGSSGSCNGSAVPPGALAEAACAHPAVLAYKAKFVARHFLRTVQASSLEYDAGGGGGNDKARGRGSRGGGDDDHCEEDDAPFVPRAMVVCRSRAHVVAFHRLLKLELLRLAVKEEGKKEDGEDVEKGVIVSRRHSLGRRLRNGSESEAEHSGDTSDGATMTCASTGHSSSDGSSSNGAREEETVVEASAPPRPFMRRGRRARDLLVYAAFSGDVEGGDRFKDDFDNGGSDDDEEDDVRSSSSNSSSAIGTISSSNGLSSGGSGGLVTEAALNSGVALADAHLIVVCAKLETGYDDPRLCAM